MIISGKDDAVGAFSKGPISLRDMYRKLGVSDVSLILYENMRHEILNEVKRDDVYKDILNFLEK